MIDGACIPSQATVVSAGSQPLGVDTATPRTYPSVRYDLCISPLMSSGFWDCEHDPGLCQCYTRQLPAQASLDELQFARSACSYAQTGAADKLERLLQRQPSAVHSDGGSGTSGYTPLHYAARAGHVACIHLLLKHGAAVDATTAAGKATPLHRAAHTGHLAAVQTLLGAGADALLADADGETALHKAAAEGHAAVAAALLQAAPGAASLLDKHGHTPQQRAVGQAAAANWPA